MYLHLCGCHLGQSHTIAHLGYYRSLCSRLLAATLPLNPPPLFLFTSSSFSTAAMVVLWKQKLDHVIPLHKNYTSSLFHSEEEPSSYDDFRGLLGSTLLLSLASYRSLQTLLHPCQSVFFQFFKYLGDTLASGPLYQQFLHCGAVFH